MDTEDLERRIRAVIKEHTDAGISVINIRISRALGLGTSGGYKDPARPDKPLCILGVLGGTLDNGSSAEKAPAELLGISVDAAANLEAGFENWFKLSSSDNPFWIIGRKLGQELEAKNGVHILA